MKTLKAKYLEIKIPSGEEIFIKNPFNEIPKYFVEANRATSAIMTKGDTPWTKDVLSFSNRSDIPVDSGLLLFLE